MVLLVALAVHVAVYSPVFAESNLCRYPAVNVTDSSGNVIKQGKPYIITCPSPNETFQIDPGKCYDIVGGSPTEIDCTAILKDSSGNEVERRVTPSSLTTNSDELDSWLQKGINFLSLAVGLVVVMSIIIAGIQYTTAGSNASQVTAAKNRITMALLALILFGFTYTLLQWLVPGGIF